jgi:hypothetical protein
LREHAPDRRAILFAGANSASASAGFRPELADIMKPVNIAIAAKTDASSTISAEYSQDAIVVDDRGPFEWTGANHKAASVRSCAGERPDSTTPMKISSQVWAENLHPN